MSKRNLNQLPIESLRILIDALQKTPGRKLSAQKRASVALIIRVRPHFQESNEPILARARNSRDFLSLPWVQSGIPEIMLIKRSINLRDRWSGHMAFPGGRNEVDEDDRVAAERECMEEIGLRLDDGAFECLGNLKDREVRNLRANKNPMSLSCYVFLCLDPEFPKLTLKPDEVAGTHWLSFQYFIRILMARLETKATGRDPVWVPIQVSLENYFPRLIGSSLKYLMGQIQYFGLAMPCSDEGVKGRGLPDEPILWGMTLGMISELMNACFSEEDYKRLRSEGFKDLVELSRPRLTHIDIHLWAKLIEALSSLGIGGATKYGNGSGIGWGSKAHGLHFTALKLGVAMALISRGGFGYAMFRFIVKRWFTKAKL